MPDQVRDDVEAAYEAVAARDAEPAEEAIEAPVAEVDAVAEEAEVTPAVEAKDSRVRDPETGKFTKGAKAPVVAKNATPPGKTDKAAAVPPVDVGQAKAGVVSPEAAPAEPVAAAVEPPEKAPQSWKPQAREQWAKLPPDVRHEVLRVDREVRSVMQDSAEARKGWQAFQETLRPHELLLRQSGQQPLQVVGQALMAFETLARGSEQDKTRLAARIIQGYGINVEQLADELSKAPQQARQQQGLGPADVEALVERRMQAMQAQSIQARAAKDIADFEASPPEFWDRVKPRAAGLLAGGVASNLQEAYDMAVGLDRDVQSILKQRDAAKAVANAQASTQRARAAASSIRPQPAAAVATPKPNGDLRSDVAAAWDEVASR